MLTFITHTNKHIRIRNRLKSYTIKAGLEHVRFVESVLNEVYPNVRPESYNLRILLGLIFDDRLHDARDIDVLFDHFYNDKPLTQISKETKSSQSEDRSAYQLRNAITRVIDVLKRNRSLIEMENVDYDDLLIAYLGLDAMNSSIKTVYELLKLSRISQAKTLRSIISKVRNDQFIEALRTDSLEQDKLIGVLSLLEKAYNVHLALEIIPKDCTDKEIMRFYAAANRFSNYQLELQAHVVYLLQTIFDRIILIK